MAEKYEAKLARRLKVRATFAPPLNVVPIRHVDKIAALSAGQRQLLGIAVNHGIRSIPLALDRLETLGADATVDLLLQDNKDKATNQAPHAADVETLIDVMTDCFPGTPALTIQSLAASLVMAEVVRVVHASREALESANIRSDFVATTFYAVIKFVKKSIEDQIKATPSLVQVIKNSGLTWDGEEE